MENKKSSREERNAGRPLHGAPVAAFQFNLDGELTGANSNFLDLIGVKEVDEILGHELCDLIEDPKTEKEVLEALGEGRDVENLEVEMSPPGLENRWGLLTAKAEGERAIAVVVDIDERMRVEKTIKTVIEVNSILVKSEPLRDIIQDAVKTITVKRGFDAACVELTGGEAIGISVVSSSSLTPSDVKELHSEEFKEKVIQKEELVLRDVTETSYSNGSFDFEGRYAVIGLPLKYEELDLGILSIHLQDAKLPTEEEIKFLRELASDLGYGIHNLLERREIRRMGQLNDVMDRVLRHNLRNDMNVISLYAEAVKESAPTSEIEEKIDSILNTSHGILAIAEKVRSFRDNYIREEELHLVDIAKFARDVKMRFENEYPEAVIQLESPERAEVLGKSVLKPALEEVVENSIVHNESEIPETVIRITEEPETVRIEVTDDGPGIPKEELEPIISGDETPLTHSTGIGLWSINWYVDIVGGDLSFENLEPGTRAEITLKKARID